MNPLPLTVKRSIELMGLAVLMLLVYYASEILAPLLLAFFLTIMIYPVFNFFQQKRLPEMFSIIMALLTLITFAALIIWFFSSQITRLIADFPTLKANVTAHLNNLSKWISTTTHFSPERQLAILDQQSNALLNLAGGYLGGFATSLTGLFIFFGLIPIYIFLLLFYRNLLLKFIFSWFREEDHGRVRETVNETRLIIKSYLLGLMIQIAYITILLGGILLLFGIRHALLIGVLFAILNLIPYVGALIGNIIGVLLTLTSSQDLSPIITVLVSIAVVQFLDNNILMPRIVGSKIKINALASIVAVIAGGLLAGISGMFLSLPVVAILKIVFDRSNRFRQWGILFGDERPTSSPWLVRRFTARAAVTGSSAGQTPPRPPVKK